MPHHTAFDPKRRFAFVRMEGDIDGADLLDATRRVLGEAGRGPFDVIWDGSGVTGLHLVPGDFDHLLDAKTSGCGTGARIRHEVLVACRSLDVMMAHFYVLLARRRGIHAHVCRSVADAKEFLGVTDLPVEAPLAVHA